MKYNRKVFVLNPSQSRRLIAKGVVALPQVQEALHNGKIFVSRGSTNGYIIEELYKSLDLAIPQKFTKEDYVAGQIVPGKILMKWGINPKMAKETLFFKGIPQEIENHVKEIQNFEEGDLVIKGGNALDLKGIPGVLVGAKNGGTIGTILGYIHAKGIEVICPIGLEKLVFANLLDLQSIMGQKKMDKPDNGIPCGMIAMPFSTPITEMEALEVLFDCETYHVASGGVGGAEGSVSILIDGFDDDEMEKIDSFMHELENEPKFQPNL